MSTTIDTLLRDLQELLAFVELAISALPAAFQKGFEGIWSTIQALGVLEILLIAFICTMVFLCYPILAERPVLDWRPGRRRGDEEAGLCGDDDDVHEIRVMIPVVLFRGKRTTRTTQIGATKAKRGRDQRTPDPVMAYIEVEGIDGDVTIHQAAEGGLDIYLEDIVVERR